ncbi:MAG: PilT/PilU family type 4a pilus ATPase [Patescibacteria group bacterium]
MEDLKKLVTLAIKKGASDIHLVAGAFPYLRIHGRLYPVKKPILTQAAVQKISDAICEPRQKDLLEAVGDVDVGIMIGNTSLRVNIHHQINGFGIAIRVVPEKIPSPEELGLSEDLVEAAISHDGFVVISGAAGSGKSTTLASLVDLINKTTQSHIITLEDPIEYRFSHEKSLIEQRQLGLHFPSFQEGLRHVLRQDPNVIVVGEMRDPETIELALTAAETGHLVFSTLHSPNAYEVVERMVGVFEGNRQQQILTQLSATLRVVIAQKLLPGKEGGRVAAREVMITNSAVRNAIRQNNLGTLKSAIQTGKRYGMVSMDIALEQLTREGKI